MPDVFLTWSITNIITIAIMMLVVAGVLILASQGYHMATGDNS